MNTFTFHNVSIKSLQLFYRHLLAGFTFHNVSIKSRKVVSTKSRVLSLHSTMYLLNRLIASSSSTRCSSFTFHNVSIKSLSQRRINISFITFTFHNVSIKSYVICHATDFLKDFTFHNVSIKSRTSHAVRTPQTALHSTMYLLNRSVNDLVKLLSLSLHSTMYLLNPVVAPLPFVTESAFTFHNVSIKSQRLSTRSMV